MELYKNTMRFAEQTWDPLRMHAGYLRVAKGTWIHMQHVGVSGEENGWLYGRDLVTGYSGWFPRAVLQAVEHEARMTKGSVGMAIREVRDQSGHERLWARTGYSNLGAGDYVLISYVGSESSDDEGWLYGCAYRMCSEFFDAMLFEWGWFPQSVVCLTSALNDHVWLTPASDQDGDPSVTGNRVLVVGSYEAGFDLEWPACPYRAAGLNVDVLGYSCDLQYCMHRASIFEQAIVLLSTRAYKACVISKFLEPPSEFLEALSTWVWNGGALLMVAGPDVSDDGEWGWAYRLDGLVYGDYIARECFGKTWRCVQACEGHADYNAGWSLSSAYDDLGGSRDHICGEFLVSALVDVPPAECAFQVADDDDDGVHCECVVAAGRFGKGLVSVSAHGWYCKDISDVQLAIAKIPSAVVWSEVRHFLLAIMERNKMRRAVPAVKSGIIYSFCRLNIPLARLILTFAFGPLHVPQLDV